MAIILCLQVCVTHRQLLSIDQVWRRSAALT